MIVAPCSSHSAGIYVVRYDVVIVGELAPADGADPVLLDDLTVEQLSHLRVRP